MGEEERGFVIKDRRPFDKDGNPREPESQDTVTKEKTADSNGKKSEAKSNAKKAPEQGDQSQRPLPEVSFTALVFSLSSSALYYLGEVRDADNREPKKDLPLAKHTIDTISMLKEKTKGNLTEEEEKFLTTVIADLKWRYVKALD